MRVMRIVLCLLLAGCAGEAAGYGDADVRGELSRTHEQRGGLMVLFAATVVEGGGVKGNNRNPPQAVLDVTAEFPGQHIAPGRVKPGKQSATLRIIASSKFEEERDFEVPMNGTRIIAFGDAGTFNPTPGGLLVVYANHMFADTEANRANLALGRAPPASQPVQLPLFVASLALAFAAIFLAWFRVKLGVIALAMSIALWFGYEATISTQTNIRVDLLILFALLLAALISVIAAAAYASKSRGKR